MTVSIRMRGGFAYVVRSDGKVLAGKLPSRDEAVRWAIARGWVQS